MFGIGSDDHRSIEQQLFGLGLPDPVILQILI